MKVRAAMMMQMCMCMMPMCMRQRASHSGRLSDLA